MGGIYLDQYVTGATIKALREKKKLTQKQLAELLAVSDKTISKWETQKGLPDITLIKPLAETLGVSIGELLSGQLFSNENRSANLRKGNFYVCPVCGNIIYAVGNGSFHCCGIALPPLEAEAIDSEHPLKAERIEDEYLVSCRHPMEKEHYLSFFAYLSAGQLQMIKLYPEQNAEARFKIHGHGTFYAFCNRHGLFSITV
jgi:DNA-binding XRE family transcriptional regulator